MNRNFLTNIRRINTTNRFGITFPISGVGEGEQKKLLSDCLLEDIFPHLIVNSSIVTIESQEKTLIATSMLTRFLESFTNHLVVMKNEVPVGVIGANEIMKSLLRNSTRGFFYSTVEQHMNRNLYFVDEKTKLCDMLREMKHNERDFAILKNHSLEFSTISARRLLEVGILCDTSMRVVDIPSRPIVTFSKDDSVEDIISSMLKNKIDVLILENTASFINPQIIFEKILEDSEHLQQIDNFLQMKTSVFKLRTIKIISENLTIPELCKIMLKMRHPFVMTRDKILTPYDMILALGNK